MSIIALISFFGILLMFGLSHLTSTIKNIRTQKDYVRLFVAKTKELDSSLRNNTDASSAIHYILSNYLEVSNILEESQYKCPVLRLGTSISFGNSVDPNFFIQISAEQIEFEGSKEREERLLKKQIYNPFILLYRGVERIMDFVLGYIIRKFNPKFKPDSSTLWKVINTIITIVGSVTSVLSYLNTR